MSASDERLGRADIADLREAIVETIRGWFPTGPVRVFKHQGKWTHKSFSQYAAAAPCIAVVWMVADDWEGTGGGTTTGAVVFTAFAITRNHQRHADDDGLYLVSLLLSQVPLNQWGLADVVGEATGVRGQNAYDNELDDKGCNVHAVSWEHQLILPVLTDEQIAALPDFLRAHTTIRVGDPAEDDAAPDGLDLNEVREP